MNRAFVIVIAIALAGLACAGCAKRHKIEVQSDGCWNGLVNEHTFIQGCGNSTYKVIGKLQCVRVQKDNTSGYVRVRIDGRAWSETTLPSGDAQACN